MTVCIAAKVTGDAVHRIVGVTDRMISWGAHVPAQDDAARKDLALARRWQVLFAGDDVRPALPIVSSASEQLTGMSNPSAQDVEVAVKSAYASYVDRHITEAFLSKFGFQNVSEFRTKGLRQLGRAVFTGLADQVEQFDLRLELLVCGFASGAGWPYIFSISSPGMVTDNNLLGYYAIGSGATMAIASISSNFIDDFSVESTIARLCFAKFNSETAYGVGKGTIVNVMDEHGHIRHLSPSVIDMVRAYWVESRKLALPETIARNIARNLA